MFRDSFGALMRIGVHILYFLMVSEYCSAQNSLENANYKIGVKISLERSGVSKFEENSKFREVINFGIPVAKKMSRHIHLESGIYYVGKNSNVTFPPNQSLLINYTFRSIRLPLMIRYDIRNLYASMGIYGDYFIDYSSDEEYYNDSFYYEINKINAGLNLNLGIESNVSKVLIVFMEIGINRDFTPFVKDGEYFKFLNYGIAMGANIPF